jgi:glycosyltransferase involved in cell wall biosynthesis
MISIVIPVAGNNFDRRTRLSYCLKALRNQQVGAKTEIIVVEQSLDGNFYHDDIRCDSYYPVKDPHNRGFNLSWLRNIGAKQAKGSHIVLMDMDIVVEQNYLFEVQKIANFAFGAKAYLWLSRQESEQYYRGSSQILSPVDHDNVMIPGVRGGCGCVLCFTKDFFDEYYGGFWEGFHNWGYEDTESAHRLLGIFGLKEVKELPRVNAIACHLYHDYDRRMNFMNGPNKDLCDKLNAMHHSDRVYLLKSFGVGRLEEPTVIKV